MVVESDEPSDRPLRQRLLGEWVTPTGAPLIAATTGALVYVLLRVTASRFYGEFGLAPEDAGLGYKELLTQSVVGFVAVAMFVILALILTGVMMLLAGPSFKPLRRFIEGSSTPTSRDRRTAAALLVAFALVALGVVLGTAISASLSSDVGALVALLVAGLGMGLLGRIQVLNSERRELVRGLTGAVVITFLAVWLVILLARADQAATDVRGGRSPQNGILGLSLVPWDAAVAHIDPASVDTPLPPEGRDTCVMLLGTSASGTWVFDPVQKRTLRLAKSQPLAIDSRDHARCRTAP